MKVGSDVFSLISGDDLPPKSDKIEMVVVKTGLENPSISTSHMQTLAKNDMQYEGVSDECHKKQEGLLGFPLISGGGHPEKRYPGGVDRPENEPGLAQTPSENGLISMTGETRASVSRDHGVFMEKNNTRPEGKEENAAHPSPSMGNAHNQAQDIPFEPAYKKFLNEIWRSIVPRTYDRLKVLRKAVDIVEGTMAKDWPDHHPALKDNLARVRGRLTVDIAKELMGVAVKAGLPRPSEMVREWRALTGGPRSMWYRGKLVPYDRQKAAELRIQRAKEGGNK